MRRRLLAALVAVATASATIAAAGCGGGNAQYGGDAEIQLIAATVAGDVAAVKALLASGANPNKLARHEDLYQSPWWFALHQLRPGRADLIAIVDAMLSAGAKPDVVYRQYRSIRLWHPSGTYQERPISEAVFNGVPEAVRAILKAGLDPRLAEMELASAIENGKVEIAHILVDAGVDVNTTRGVTTPLVAAIEARNVALMIYLEAHGAREKP